MIDKIELRLPSATYFRREIRTLLRQVDHATARSFMRPSRFYAGVGDLRPYGIDGLLHYRCKMGGHGNHKLEMLETGAKSYSALVAQVEAVVDGAIDDLGTMRIDLCADLVGVPVSWLHPRLSFLYKRISHQIGPLTWETISKAGIETISAGKRPNIIRCYDKVAECKMQFKRRIRKASPDADPLDFETESGFSLDSVRTRIERQFGGGRIPKELATFGKLPAAPFYNPFDVLEMTGDTGAVLPLVGECDSVTEYLAGTALNRMILETGFQPTRRWLNVESNGNGARMLKKYHRFLPSSNHGTNQTVMVPHIFETYRTSVTRQLSA